jgi:hypothetical protein
MHGMPGIHLSVRDVVMPDVVMAVVVVPRGGVRGVREEHECQHAGSANFNH